MARSGFVPNPNFVKEMERKSTGPLLVAAAAVSVQAERTAHRIMPSGRGTFEIQVEGDAVRLANVDHGGHLDEFGSRNNPPYAPLRTAVRSERLRMT